MRLYGNGYQPIRPPRPAVFFSTLFFAGLLLIIMTVNQSQATLMSVDDARFGPDAVTRDPETGLEWLDVTQTTNRSFNDISTLLGSEEVFTGWRYATSSQVQRLFESAGGMTFNQYSIDPRDLEAARGLVQLLGVTAVLTAVEGGLIYDVIGMTETIGTSPYPGNRVMSLIQYCECTAQASPRAYLASFWITTPDDFATGSNGSFLIRSIPVPEPGTFFLLITGLAGLLGAMWRCPRATSVV